MEILSAILSGLALGGVYGLIALGFHITNSVSGTLNFAQGSSAMLGAVVGLMLVNAGAPFAAAAVVAVLACALYGALVEAVAVRPFVARGSNAWLMATVALGLVLDNGAMFVFGAEPRSFPSSLATSPVSFGGLELGVYPLHLIIPVVALAAGGGLHLFRRRTLWGTAMLAVAQNARAAALMGIPIQGVVTAAYAGASALAGVAGLMAAPLSNVQAGMGVVLGLKAFAVAILGGLQSAWGVVIAALMFGVAEASITLVVGSGYAQIATFAAIVLVLAVKPDGLLGRAAVRKV
jgi:branched-chain amino acid transport system permease protein